MRSPLDISYNDLVKFAESRLKFMLKNYTTMKANGQISNWNADHNLECGKQLLKLLKKYQREKQGDLFETFKNLKK